MIKIFANIYSYVDIKIKRWYLKNLSDQDDWANKFFYDHMLFFQMTWLVIGLIKDILREEGFVTRAVAYWKQLIGQTVYVVVSDYLILQHNMSWDFADQKILAHIGPSTIPC